MVDRVLTPSDIGKYVTFFSRHPTDNTQYKGAISGIINLRLAKTLTNDLQTYYNAIRASTQLPSIEDLNWFSLDVDSTERPTIAFATEFISNFNEVNLTNVNIVVENVTDQDVQRIRRLLSNSGYRRFSITLT